MSIPVQPSGEDGVVHDHDGINGKLWKGRNVWEGGDRDDTMENVTIALIILIINYHLDLFESPILPHRSIRTSRVFDEPEFSKAARYR